MTPLRRLFEGSKGLNNSGAIFDGGQGFRNGDRLGLWESNSVGSHETIGDNFEKIVERAYRQNGVVFACILARMLSFSEGRFAYQRETDGRPGDFVDGPGLDVLRRPWLNGTTGELLARMEQDASLAGNFFATRVTTGSTTNLRRLRPDWVTIVSGGSDGPNSTDATVIAYLYKVPGKRTVILPPDEVVHYSPIPDPVSQWRGMSWVSSVLPEVQADNAATAHKGKFFENGTLSTLAITYDPSIDAETVRDFKKIFDDSYTGPDNAYKTLHLGGGADPRTLGVDLKALDFKAVQGAGETRIAAAAGVGSIIARLSEGMQGSSLNQGNFSAAKRQFGDMTLRPLWRIGAASFEKFTSPPDESRLAVDTRDIAFLREDEAAASETLAKNMTAIKAAVDAGFDPDAAIRAVAAGDLKLLIGSHSGLYSVQLQPPSSKGTP